jgi:hypothetical protein
VRNVPKFFQTYGLGDIEKGTENNLNPLRLLFATAVIFSHCFVLRGEYAKEPMHSMLGWAIFEKPLFSASSSSAAT